MIDSNYVLMIDLKPLVELFKNNQLFFIFGSGSIAMGILYGISRLVKVISENKREKFKILLSLKIEAFNSVKALIKTFKNKTVAQIRSSLENERISKKDLCDLATKINDLFYADKDKFSENKALFGDKATNSILKEHKKYKLYFMNHFPENMTVADFTRELVQKQLFHYLEFNKVLTQELDNVERRLSKELGICN